MICLMPAFTDASRKLVYRIRHEVYCEELGFENTQPDGHERDEYDRHSLHCLAHFTGDMTPVGCIRLVLPRPEAPDHPLPFEEVCRIEPDRSLLALGRRRHFRIAEISRFAVRRQFRRRPSEKISALMNGTRPKGIPHFSDIPMALYLGSIAMAEAHGIDTLYALSEPHMRRFFSRIGLASTPIGEPVEHHGLRIPSTMNVRQFLHNMNPAVRPVWHAIRHEIRAHLQGAAFLRGWHGLQRVA